MTKVELTDETIARLKALAEPLVDTFDTVIGRLLDAYSLGIPSRPQSSGADLRDFNPVHSPDLKHTKVLSATIDGEDIPRGTANWNGILNLAVAIAARRSRNVDELRNRLLVNFVQGRKEDEGYRFLDDINLSIQGQDANSAWKAALHIFRAYRVQAAVTFTWRDKHDAAHPGTVGRFMLNKS